MIPYVCEPCSRCIPSIIIPPQPQHGSCTAPKSREHIRVRNVPPGSMNPNHAVLESMPAAASRSSPHLWVSGFYLASPPAVKPRLAPLRASCNQNCTCRLPAHILAAATKQPLFCTFNKPKNSANFEAVYVSIAFLVRTFSSLEGSALG